jgi:hypothetical protein
MDVVGHETSEQLSRALGEVVVKMWSYLPHDVQYHLFEGAVNRARHRRGSRATKIDRSHSSPASG